jgi:hypothetical protein
MSSPVSSRASGERNAIRSRMHSESGLDFASRISWDQTPSIQKKTIGAALLKFLEADFWFEA